MSTSPRTPFTPAEWGAIALIILVWGLNNAAAKIATEALPPLFMGGMRFLIALVLLIPFLKPPWPPWRQLLPLVLLAGLLIAKLSSLLWRGGRLLGLLLWRLRSAATG